MRYMKKKRMEYGRWAVPGALAGSGALAWPTAGAVMPAGWDEMGEADSPYTELSGGRRGSAGPVGGSRSCGRKAAGGVGCAGMASPGRLGRDAGRATGGSCRRGHPPHAPPARPRLDHPCQGVRRCARNRTWQCARHRLTRPRACGSESTGGSEGCMAGAVPTRRLPDPRGGPCGRARTTRSARKRWAAAPLRNLRKKKSKRFWRELPRNHFLRKRDTFWRMAAYDVFLFSSVRYFVC